MIKILTSSLNNYYKKDGESFSKEIDNKNGLVNIIQNNLKETNGIVYIASNSNDFKKTNLYARIIFESLRIDNIVFDNYYILDERNKSKIDKIISSSNLVILGGGDTYIENQFFNELKLKGLLKNYKGIILGISAGSINMANDVFNSPEEREMSEEIYFKGLALTNINIEPHFILDDSLFDESERFQRNFILKESFKRDIYALVDGSFLYIKDDVNVICGKCYLTRDGKIEEFCHDKFKKEIK